MNSKEIVKKTIHFGRPERLPYLVYIDMKRFEEEREKDEIAAVKRMAEQARKDFILRNAVLDYNLGINKQWLELGVDGIFVSDDWGGQKKFLVNPDYWRKFCKSSYKEMFDLIHEGDADVWMHSCGNVTDLISDLVELKLDVLNPVQPQAMDIDYLGKTYGGKICFHGGLDVQETIPHGTPTDIENETRHFIHTLGSRNGGYIPGTSHTILPDTPVENIEMLFKALDYYSSNPGF